MSYEAINAVKKQSKARGTAYTLMLVLATYPPVGSFSSYPSRETLMHDARIHCERTLQRTLRKLESLGELRVIAGCGRGNLTTYEITLTETGKSIKDDIQMTPFSTLPDSAKGDALLSPFTAKKRVTPAPERVTNEAERVTSQSVKGDISGRAYKDIESHEESTKEGAAAARGRDVPLHETDGVKAVQEIFGRVPPINGQELIAKQVTDLPIWRAVCQEWGASYGATPKVVKMLEIYHEKVEQKGSNASNRQHRNSAKPKPTPNIAEFTNRARRIGTPKAG